MDAETLAGQHAALRRLFFLLLNHVASDNPALVADMREAILASQTVSHQLVLDDFGKRSRKAAQGFEAVMNEALANLSAASS